MLITQKRINNADNIIKSLPSGIKKIRIAYSFKSKVSELEKVGFDPSAVNEGDSILPKVIGSVSRLNAHGSYLIRKDLPKENRFVCQIYVRLKNWSGIVDRYRDCFPREEIMAPGKEFIYLNNHLTSEVLSIKNHELVKHVINLFLEFFGECQVVYEDLSEIIITKRVNWKILPEGEHLWERVEAYLKITKSGSDGIGIPIAERQKFIINSKPKNVVVGNAGFLGYLVYCFDNHTILESTRRNNATYVFDQNWEEFSKLSKAEIISGNLHKARIIHSDGWKAKIKDYLN